MNNEDKIERARQKQLDKYLDSLEYSDMELSNCCGEPICEDSSICCGCKENCVSRSDEAESQRDDWADAKYEEMRERRNE